MLEYFAVFADCSAGIAYAAVLAVADFDVARPRAVAHPLESRNFPTFVGAFVVAAPKDFVQLWLLLPPMADGIRRVVENGWTLPVVF